MAMDLTHIITGRQKKPPKVTIYGVGGVGKTFFAAQAPKPIFLCSEEGLGTLDVARFEPRPRDPVLRSWSELIECVFTLYQQEHHYETVVLDSLDQAEPLLWKHTSTRHGQKDIEAFGYGKGYVHAVDEARVLLEGLEALRNDRGMSIILIAHSQIKRFESPTAESYDRFQLRLQDRLGALIHDWSDAVLFANWKTHTVEDIDPKSKRTRRRGVGRGERMMYTEERPGWWAKNRFSLPFELPLDWNSFIEAMTASMETATSQVAIPATPATTKPNPAPKGQ